ncbi:zinc-dependent alcohol dehydrogenase family protein [Nakamurella flavida]|uniref:Zinc-dependent alcohol dehydrogenase family protein n=1 Tax=Nakamurella flavida TaxID=363630 RepID=A0A939C6Y0_9ACTN|nr:zinc-dependent alcohol dehydrogenase family protein [Nakamurella flavida]MBM9477602.1 zinc-dependent alcohol dehydrogenase family protein [Nakamurella flavida]MDP9779150.1 threonine dehydrogenase-like Zn-dependent dehydrogenase [Nakamurella flavida]
MLAAVLHAARSISADQVPDPELIDPTDAIVQVTAACVCGSDLWPYRGVREASGRIGHEFVGVVQEVGAEVRTVKAGDFVIAPFVWSDGTCANCQAGIQTSCLHGGGWGADDRNGHLVDGGQGEFVRVPQADGTLVWAPVSADSPLVPALLSLSDVMGTGHHAALAAGVTRGSTAVVVGDGAVGLSAVLAASRLGAERIIALSSHADRAEMATRFGATDIVGVRGDEAVAAVRELTDGLGAAHVLECVGTTQSWDTAFGATRPGGTIGYVGVPAGLTESFPIRKAFGGNIAVRGGVAPVRAYIPELLADVLDGTLDPSPVFTLELPLTEIAQAYRAMDERTAIKVLVRP